MKTIDDLADRIFGPVFGDYGERLNETMLDALANKRDILAEMDRLGVDRLKLPFMYSDEQGTQFASMDVTRELLTLRGETQP